MPVPFLCALYLLGAASDITEAPGLTDLIRDRPQLLDIIQRGDPLWTWLNSRFANTNNQEVLWSDKEPQIPSHYLASHSYDEFGRVVISVRRLGDDGKPLGAEELISNVVFELINGSHKNDFDRLDRAAANGAISKDQFVNGTAKVEFDSIMQLKQFAVDVWIPYAVSKHLPFLNDYWDKGIPEDFDRWLYMCRLSHNGYPDDTYGPFYDKLTKKIQVHVPTKPPTAPVNGPATLQPGSSD